MPSPSGLRSPWREAPLTRRATDLEVHNFADGSGVLFPPDPFRSVFAIRPQSLRGRS